MVYPLRILHQKKFLEQSYEDSFKDFVSLELKMNLEQLLESVEGWNETMKQEFTNDVKDAPIYIGYPEALTSTQFLQIFYSNLNLTGEEGLFKMNQEMKQHSNKLYNDFKTISLQNISENEKDILKSFVVQHPKSKHHLWRYPQFGTNVIRKFLRFLRNLMFQLMFCLKFSNLQTFYTLCTILIVHISSIPFICMIKCMKSSFRFFAVS